MSTYTFNIYLEQSVACMLIASLLFPFWKAKIKTLNLFSNTPPPSPPRPISRRYLPARHLLYYIETHGGGALPPSRTIVPSQGHTFFLFRGGGGFKSGKRNRSYQGRRLDWDHHVWCTPEILRGVGNSDFLSSIFYSERL
jgi:hypothetical protein